MQYRKKPVVVDAARYKAGMEDGFELIWIAPWMTNSKKPEHITIRNLVTSHYGPKSWTSDSYRKIPYINTLEGKHYIAKGDYIVTGIKGERYPCKPDIFHLTYEPVEDEAPPAISEPESESEQAPTVEHELQTIESSPSRKPNKNKGIRGRSQKC